MFVCMLVSRDQMSMPPSIAIACPVMKVDESDARKSTVSAISWGVPIRFMGIISVNPLGSPLVILSAMSVAMGPGATVLTRMLDSASSAATERESPSTANLDAA